MRKTLVHRPRVEVPDGRPLHDVQAERSEDAEVNRRVELLHEPRLFRSAANPEVDGDGFDEPLHKEFPREGEEERVEGHEGEVPAAFAELCRRGRVGGREAV